MSSRCLFVVLDEGSNTAIMLFDPRLNLAHHVSASLGPLVGLKHGEGTAVMVGRDAPYRLCVPAGREVRHTAFLPFFAFGWSAVILV